MSQTGMADNDSNSTGFQSLSAEPWEQPQERSTDHRPLPTMAPLTIHRRATTPYSTLEEAWRTLEECSDHSFFQSWSWIGSWLTSLPSDIQCSVLEAYDADRRVGLGIVVEGESTVLKWIKQPTAFLHETGRAECDLFAIEYNGFLIARGYEEAASRALTQYLLTRSNVDRVVLSGIAEPSAERLLGMKLPQGWLPHEVASQPYYLVDLRTLRERKESYLSTLSGNTRSRIKRARSGWEKLGSLSVQSATDEREAQLFFDALVTLHRRRFEEKGEASSFIAERSLTLHRDLIRRFLNNGIDLLRISAGSVDIGYLYNFSHRGHIMNYQSGIDFSREESNPGLLCHTLAIEHYLMSGAMVYDLLAGESQYKRSLSTGSGTMRWITLQRRTSLGQTDRKLRKIKQRLQRVPAPPQSEKIQPLFPRVLILIDTAYIGGPGKGLLQFFRHADLKRFSFRLATFTYKNPRSTEFIEASQRAGLDVVLLPQRFRFDPRPLLHLMRLIKEEKFNIVQTHGYKGHLIALLLKAVVPFRWIAFTHGWTSEDLKVKIYQALDRYALRFCDCAVAVSSELQRQVTGMLSKGRRAELVLNAADPSDLRSSEETKDLRTRFDIPADHLLIGCFARLSPEKGHQLLLDALKILGSKKVSLLIVGEGPLRATLEAAVREKQLQEQVFFMSYQTAMKDLYDAIDLLVLPSYKEGLPNVALEAMSMGKPVLGTRVGAMPELIEDGNNGMLIEPGDANELAKRIHLLLADRSQLADLGIRGQRSLTPRFSPKERAKKIVDLYARVLHNVSATSGR